MSYRRSYQETITVSGSKTVNVSYPASQSGGNIPSTVSYTERVPVNININVDTNSFDSSISGCNNSVSGLIGAVVATEAAQIASINKNAKKIAGTVINGFFKHVRFEISSQITELTQRVEANLLHLRELSKQLTAKKTQMEVDYNRTSNRYIKIFDDFNNELTNRIYELNKPAFSFKQQADAHNVRSSVSDMVSVVAVSGLENGYLQSKISASTAKKRALMTINQANVFLQKQKKAENTINRSLLKGDSSAIHSLPICFIETNNDKNMLDEFILKPDYLSKIDDAVVIKILKDKCWEKVSKEKKEAIDRYFNLLLNRNYSSIDSHSNRVKKTILKIHNSSSTKSIYNKSI